MTDLAPISDDVWVLRHVPSGLRYQMAPGEFTSANFEVRTGQDGLSVSIYRDSRSVGRLLSFIQGTDQSLVVGVRVGSVRDAGFDVISDPLPGFDEHALITGKGSPPKGRKAFRRLKNLFEPISRLNLDG